LGQYEKALEDAEKCIELNHDFTRGYQRKGTALFYLDKLEDAITTYKQGLQIDPNNAALNNDLKAAEDKKNQ
jgi:stress-induced-phosphoprotein 1